MNADLRSGHDGLASLAKQFEIDVRKLLPGEYLVFINSAKNKIKVYAANNVVAYLKLSNGGRVDLNSIRYIPQAFTASGQIDYDEALKRSIEEGMKKQRGYSPLAVYAEMQNAGVA